MYRLLRKLNLSIAAAILLAIASFNLFPAAVLGQTALELQGAIVPGTQPEVSAEFNQMPHQRMQMQMQMSGEMLVLMGETHQLMAELTPEQMQEFRPLMAAHHSRMVEEMQDMVEQLRNITAEDSGVDAD